MYGGCKVPPFIIFNMRRDPSPCESSPTELASAPEKEPVRRHSLRWL